MTVHPMKTHSVKAVVFTSPYCVVCEILASQLMDIADEIKIPVKVYMVDVVEAPDVAGKYCIRTVPTTFIGEERFEGTVDDEDLRELLTTAYCERQASPIDKDERLFQVAKSYPMYWYELASKINVMVKDSIKKSIKGEEMRNMGDKATMHLINTLGLSLIEESKGRKIGHILRRSANLVADACIESIDLERVESIESEIKKYAERLGLGRIELVKETPEKMICRVHECYLCVFFKDQKFELDFPYCLWMGEFLLAVFSHVAEVTTFKEIRCTGMGDPYCEFELYKRKKT